MYNNFQDVMAKRTDNELVIIVSTERHKYQQVAIEAAEIEIEKRKINPAIIIELKEKVKVENSKKDSILLRKANIQNRIINQVIDFMAIAFLYSFIKIITFGTLKSEDGMDQLLFFVAYFFYYIYLENNYQQTLGKFYTKTKVVTLNGDKPSLKKIIARTLLRTIPYDLISFIIERNGFHDNISKTTVIEIE